MLHALEVRPDQRRQGAGTQPAARGGRLGRGQRRRSGFRWSSPQRTLPRPRALRSPWDASCGTVSLSRRSDREEAGAVTRPRVDPAMAAALCAGACLCRHCRLALSFSLPGTGDRRRQACSEALTSYALPIGPWLTAACRPGIVEGAVDQRAWRLDAAGLSTTLAADRPAARSGDCSRVRASCSECEATACGGFDFRFGTEVLPEPDMHVDLGDFRFLSAAEASGPTRCSLLVSRRPSTGFVQMTRVGARAAARRRPLGKPLPIDPDLPPTDPAPAPSRPPTADRARRAGNADGAGGAG